MVKEVKKQDEILRFIRAEYQMGLRVTDSDAVDKTIEKAKEKFTFTPELFAFFLQKINAFELQQAFKDANGKQVYPKISTLDVESLAAKSGYPHIYQTIFNNLKTKLHASFKEDTNKKEASAGYMLKAAQKIADTPAADDLLYRTDLLDKVAELKGVVPTSLIAFGTLTSKEKIIYDTVTEKGLNKKSSLNNSSPAENLQLLKKAIQEVITTLEAADQALMKESAKSFHPIQRRGNKFVVLSRKTKKILGEHDTRKEAEEQLKAIQASMHTGKKAIKETDLNKYASAFSNGVLVTDTKADALKALSAFDNEDLNKGSLLYDTLEAYTNIVDNAGLDKFAAQTFRRNFTDKHSALISKVKTFKKDKFKDVKDELKFYKEVAALAEKEAAKKPEPINRNLRGKNPPRGMGVGRNRKEPLRANSFYGNNTSKEVKNVFRNFKHLTGTKQAGKENSKELYFDIPKLDIPEKYKHLVLKEEGSEWKIYVKAAQDKAIATIHDASVAQKLYTLIQQLLKNQSPTQKTEDTETDKSKKLPDTKKEASLKTLSNLLDSIGADHNKVYIKRAQGEEKWFIQYKSAALSSYKNKGKAVRLVVSLKNKGEY